MQCSKYEEGFTFLEKGTYKEAEVFFKDILLRYPLNKTAYNADYKAFTFYNNQKDIVTFLKKLDNEFTPYLVTKTSYSSDN